MPGAGQPSHQRLNGGVPSFCAPAVSARSQVGPYAQFPNSSEAADPPGYVAAECDDTPHYPGTWYSGLAAPMFNASEGYLCKGSHVLYIGDERGAMCIYSPLLTISPPPSSHLAPPPFPPPTSHLSPPGVRYATPSDFPNSPFGSFSYTVPNGAFASDPLEARIMAGQAAGADRGRSWGNEDTGLSALVTAVGFDPTTQQPPPHEPGQGMSLLI